MITLAAGSTIQGLAAVATSVTYTLHGLELTSAGVESYKKLAQGQVSVAVGVLYTVPALTTAFVKAMSFANTAGIGVAVTLYIDGTTAAQQIVRQVIPANGVAIWAGDGWQVHDANGALLTSTATGGASKNYSARVFARSNWR